MRDPLTDFLLASSSSIPLEEASSFFIKLKYASGAPPVDQKALEEAEKTAVSNDWVARKAVNGLGGRAAKAGRAFGKGDGDTAKHVVKALGDTADLGKQKEVVKKLKDGTGLTQSSFAKAKKPEAKAVEVKKIIPVGDKKKAIGAVAGSSIAGAVSGYAAGKRKEASYGKGLAHGGLTGFGLGAGATAVALDAAHRHADNKRADRSKDKDKSAAEVMDGLLSGSFQPDSKHGHYKVAALSMRMKLAALKLAAGQVLPETEGKEDPADAGALEATPVDQAQGTPPQPEPVPAGYVQSELSGMAAQNANEAAYYRGQVESAQQQAQVMQQQVEQMQQQLDQIKQQSAVSGVQTQTSMNQAQEANDRALQYSTDSANLRIGVQKMREALMQLASQDPSSAGPVAQQEQAQMAQQEQAAMGAEGGQPGQPGAPEEAPTDGAPPAEPGADASGATDTEGAVPQAAAETEGAAADTAKPAAPPSADADKDKGGVKSINIKTSAAYGAKATGLNRVGQLLTGSRVGELAHRAESKGMAEMGSRSLGNHALADRTFRAKSRITDLAGAEQKAVNTARAGAAVGAGAVGLGAAKAFGGQDKQANSLKELAPYLAGGALLGAGAGAYDAHQHGKKQPEFEQHLSELESAQSQDETFERAVQIAKAKADIEQAKLVNRFPDRAMTRAGLSGAKQGLMMGGMAGGGVNEIRDAFNRLR